MVPLIKGRRYGEQNTGKESSGNNQSTSGTCMEIFYETHYFVLKYAKKSTISRGKFLLSPFVGILDHVLSSTI